jgi:hypothetical protein
MADTRILLPAVALVGVTFLVLMQVPIRRFRAAFAGKVDANDFKYGESDRVPDEVGIPNRNLMNLLEMPVLFYVCCLAFYVTRTTDPVALGTAWAYVVLRVGHSLVHLTYNKVMHRLTLFALSNVVLGALWMKLAATIW